jgi:hypothetical protein
MSNFKNVDIKRISRDILSKFWVLQVMNPAVQYLKSNKSTVNNLQQHTADSAQGTYLELHTWFPYENSDSCNPATRPESLKVFAVRNLSDLRRSEIFRGPIDKNFNGCPIQFLLTELPSLVYSTEQGSYNDSKFQAKYFQELEVELVRVIGKALNMTPQIVYFGKLEYKEILEFIPRVFVGIPEVENRITFLTEHTRSFFSERFACYTPCAVKYQRWSRFFNIFSVDMWICFALSLALAIITVRCISNYGHKSQLNKSNSYSNIFSVSSNIIAVLLSVSLNTQPRSAPLRLFFFCWVCYSVAISTVFQAYLTTFLMEPGYEEPIRNIEQMLKSEKISVSMIGTWWNTSSILQILLTQQLQKTQYNAQTLLRVSYGQLYITIFQLL